MRGEALVQGGGLGGGGLLRVEVGDEPIGEARVASRGRDVDVCLVRLVAVGAISELEVSMCAAS